MTGNQAAPDCPSDVVVIDPSDGGTLAMPPARLDRRPTRLAEPTIADPLAAARSEDSYLRQLGATRLAAEKSTAELQDLLSSDDERTRRAGVLAIGTKLTVPGPHDVPPPEVKLITPADSAFFKVKQSFWGLDQPVDLAALGPMGSYTIATRWGATPPSPEQQLLFTALAGALDDRSSSVRLQAAWYLDLVNDPRSQPLVEATRRDVLVERLAGAELIAIRQAWRCGPFADTAAGRLEPAHPPEAGLIDLTARYSGSQWQEVLLDESFGANGDAPSSIYFYVRIDSESRQPAVLRVQASGAVAIWNNSTPVGVMASGRNTSPSASVDERRFVLDLQPGGNDLLVRWQARGAAAPRITVQAAAKLTSRLPDKLDSSLLAERLRDAAQVGSDPAALKPFEGVDWSRAAQHGDTAEGRRLFGTLGCVKCHAITAQQEIVGAPSLADARRRFTVPHLVESILVPGRQVAEPFRSQTLLLVDGRVITGLAVGESSDAVQLVLPDATRTSVPTSSIDERTTASTSVMPTGLVKTPQELEHLLSYLLSDNPSPP